MEKGTSQFCWSAGRCGAMRRGVHAGMPLGCPVPAQGVQQPRPRQPPWAGSQGMGMQQPRPGRACVGALACPWAQAAGPLGARRVPEGQWQHGEGVACPVGGMPRPWHALGTPRRPWQHLGGLLLPSLDSLFGHLPTLPPLKSA